MIKDFEKNWHWGKVSNYAEDGQGGCRYTWDGWSVRIGWHQVALWRNYTPVFEWFPWWSERRYTFRKGLYIGGRAILTYGK